MPQQFPRRIERGPLAGQEFSSRADYRRALAAERGALTEYGARSIAARERGFPHYAAERRAREAAAAPTRGAVEGTLPNGHAWKIVNYRIGARQWHKVFDRNGNPAGGQAPRESDLPRVTQVTVWTAGGGFGSYLFDGDLLTWDDWYAVAEEHDGEYG